MEFKSPESTKSIISKKGSLHSEVNSKYKTGSKNSLRGKSSRKSKYSVQSQVELELNKEEEKLLIVNSLSKEIIKAAFETIYERYLEKQSVYFVAHCSYLAWKSLIELNYQRKDKGGFKEFLKEELDVEPDPSIKDSWAGYSTPFAKYDQQNSTIINETEPISSEISETTVVESGAQAPTEPAYSYEQIRKMSLLTAHKQTFSRPRESVKIIRKSDEVSQGKNGRSVDLKKDLYDLPSPVAMQTKYFPPSRVEVGYTIIPGSKGLVSKKPPKIKTIHLNKQLETECHSK